LAVKGRRHSYSYSQLDQASNAIAAAMLTENNCRNSTVALFPKHDPQMIECTRDSACAIYTSGSTGSASWRSALGNMFGPLLSVAMLVLLNVHAFVFFALTSWLMAKKISVYYHSSPKCFLVPHLKA
jgi:acyl-coenzyme A synthetase/AMP-(fatty) acid ligase